MKTLVAKQLRGNERKWFVVDATGKNLGRLATQAARILSGRDRVDFTPHIDNGANLIIINAEKIAVTGTKESVKMYRSHSQYMGGLKETVLGKMRDKNPTHILRHAIEGMLPKNRLRNGMSLRLKLVVGSDHEFDAQKPESITL
jgi:large subunit ribosomal protein L13